MRKPAVILAARNAEAIATRRPDAFVIDHEKQRIWHGREVVRFGEPGYCNQLFKLAAAVLSSADGMLDDDRLYESFYGLSWDGGPDNPRNIFDQRRASLRHFFNWAGISVRAHWGFHQLECRWRENRVRLVAPHIVRVHRHRLSFDLVGVSALKAAA